MLDEEERKKVVATATEKLTFARKSTRELLQEYMYNRRASQMDEETWIQDELSDPTTRLFDEWESLIRAIRRATFYEPVSAKEKDDIISAFRHEFSHRGHFYRCPNGHVYVIGECGGATETAVCPECGASVGGQGHTLNATNTRATEFEELLGQQGSGASPWAWGAGA